MKSITFIKENIPKNLTVKNLVFTLKHWTIYTGQELYNITIKVSKNSILSDYDLSSKEIVEKYGNKKVLSWEFAIFDHQGIISLMVK